MSKSDAELPKVAPASTKKEILDAYNQLVEQLAARSTQELRPSSRSWRP